MGWTRLEFFLLLFCAAVIGFAVGFGLNAAF